MEDAALAEALRVPAGGATDPPRLHFALHHAGLRGEPSGHLPLELCARPAPRRKATLATGWAISGFAPALLEQWVAYHLLYGFEHVLVLDRNDEYGERLCAYERAGLVTRQVWPSHLRNPPKPGPDVPFAYFDQFGIINTLLWRLNGTSEWLFFCDLDEYLHMPEPWLSTYAHNISRLLDDDKNPYHGRTTDRGAEVNLVSAECATPSPRSAREACKRDRFAFVSFEGALRSQVRGGGAPRGGHLRSKGPLHGALACRAARRRHSCRRLP